MRTKILLILFFSTFGGLRLNAQLAFQKTYGGTNAEKGKSVQQTNDGGYIISGETNSYGSGSNDVYLIKTDVNGDLLWTKTYGGNGQDGARSVQQTADGGYIITGYTMSFGAGNMDVYLIKVNSLGVIKWSKSIGGTGVDVANCVRQTTDGGYILSGETNSFGAGSFDVYLIKTDSLGNSLWTKTFGGTAADGSYSVKQTAEGGYIITGYTNSFGAGMEDVYLNKTDANGNLVWTKTFGGTNSDVSSTVQQTVDGGFIVSGSTNSFGAGGFDTYLVKTHEDGDTLWTKTYGGTGLESGIHVRQTTDNGYLISGETSSFGAGSSDAYCLKTDINGNYSWAKTFGGTALDASSSVQQTSDGGFIMAGNIASFGSGSIDVYLIKTDNNGNSGCNEGNPTMTTGTPATKISSAFTTISSGGTTINAVTLVSGGGTSVTLCTTLSKKTQALDTITICKDIRNIVFSIKTITGNAIAWQWTLTGTSFSGKLNDSVCGPVPYNTVGIFTTTCKVSYNNAKDSTHRFIIKVFDGKVQMPQLKDTMLCGPVSLTLDAGNSTNPYVIYKWIPTGQTTRTININAPGTYGASVFTLDDFSYKCTNCVACDSQTKIINVLRGAKAAVDLGPDRFICGDNPAILDAGAGYSAYSWLPNNETSQTISVLMSGDYSVTVTNSDGCSASDQIHLKDSCPMYIFTPNAITMDGDGLNDIFNWAGNMRMKTFRLEVFNRWGEKLFQTEDPQKGWNGFYQNQPVIQGVYWYLIECSDTNEGRHFLRGTITVLR